MGYQQLRAPNLNTTDIPGWCLRLVLHSFGFNSGAQFARAEWDRNTTKHTDDLPTDVAVPIFYSWYGTIDGETRDWGDVAIYVPGRGVFGTPMRGGVNNRWDASIAARRVAIGNNATYLGWTESLNGTQLIQAVAPPPPPRKDIMSEQDCINLCRAMLGRFDEVYPDSSHGWLKSVTGATFDQVYATLVNHPEHVAMLNTANAIKLLSKVGQ